MLREAIDYAIDRRLYWYRARFWHCNVAWLLREQDNEVSRIPDSRNCDDKHLEYRMVGCFTTCNRCKVLTLLFLKSLFDPKVKSVNLIAFFAFLEVLLGLTAFCTKGILWQ